MTAPGGAGPRPGPGDEALRRWYAARERVEAQRDALLASDAERDQVCALLSGAFSEGRLTSVELEERTSRALSARTRGESSTTSWRGSRAWSPGRRGRLDRSRDCCPASSSGSSAC